MEIKDKILRKKTEDKEKMTDEDMKKVFDDVTDVELILLEEEAYNHTSEALDKLLSSDNFEDNLDEYIGSLYALFIYLKVCDERKLKDKTIGELSEEYKKLLHKE